jgi:hypothetical protein
MNSSEDVEFSAPLVKTSGEELTRYSVRNEEGEEVFEPPSVEKLFYAILEKKQGGCGKYQWITSSVVMAGLICFGYIEYVVSYLELVPIITCTLNGVPDSVCTTEDICMGENTPQIDF